jgi:hypothetical protein
MLKALTQKSWWLAITWGGVSQPGAVGPGAAALVIATLLTAIAHAIWLLLPQLWRDRHCHELASSQAKIGTEARYASFWRPAAGPKTARFRTRTANRQEHHHAYP